MARPLAPLSPRTSGSTRAARRRALSLSLGLVLAPSSALAQAFTVLPVERDARASEADRAAAFDAVRDSGVLGPAARFEPVGLLVERLPDAQRALAECVEVDCAARLARAAGLDAVLVVAVWPDARGRAQSVAVTLVDPEGRMSEADAEVGERGVAQAATHAVVQAARRRERGGGGDAELRVHSRPAGALVLVDDAEVGVTPYVGSFAAGPHRVVVRLEGREQARDVELGGDTTTVDVDLTATGGGAAGRDVHIIHTVGPLVVGALGLAAAGAFFYGLVAQGCDSRDPSEPCRAPNDGIVTMYAIASPVLLAAAVVWWFVARRSPDEPPARAGASLRLAPTALGLGLAF